MPPKTKIKSIDMGIFPAMLIGFGILFALLIIIGILTYAGVWQ